MALIDELYSHADSEGHAAARFAEMVADRVYEYESESVLVPFATQAEALAFLLSDRGEAEGPVGDSDPERGFGDSEQQAEDDGCPDKGLC